MEEVILVDENDNAIGKMEKMEAHKKGLLHRAFSVFIFNDQKQMLIHQRSKEKYHSPQLWTNACCSHPRYNETTLDAAKRRLKEEMGIQCDIKKSFDFIYKTTFDNQLIEHEFDHVFIGKSNEIPKINPTEVMDWKYVPINKLNEDIIIHSEQYTIWFKIAFKKLTEGKKI